MPDDQTDAGAAGADDDATNGGTDDSTTDDAATSDAAASDGDLSPGAKKALAASRKAEREATKRATALEAKVREFEDRDKSEAQRATEAAAAAERERDEARAEVAQIRREGWILNAAAAAKFLDPEDAVALLAREDIEDAAGAKSAIDGLAKAKPHLLGERPATAGSFGGGQRGGGNGGSTDNGGMNDFMRRKAGI